MTNISFHPAITGLAADPKKKLVTAYILFSADIRKLTMEENPGGIPEKILKSCLKSFLHVPYGRICMISCGCLYY
jgi:hypothetical protein